LNKGRVTRNKHSSKPYASNQKASTKHKSLHGPINARTKVTPFPKMKRERVQCVHTRGPLGTARLPRMMHVDTTIINGWVGEEEKGNAGNANQNANSYPIPGRAAGKGVISSPCTSFVGSPHIEAFKTWRFTQARPQDKRQQTYLKGRHA
jgi:hypothetical protein